jgi:DNA (cytosine-5)-methyltransferase 1
MNYYNEIDKYAAQWLRNLIEARHIPNGDVDDRSISDVRPSDLVGYTQCHFFAGIGGWSLALRLAGWPDDRPVWTGSCPCQPFSVAGQGHGVVDERHLWPHWFHLIRAQRPPVVLGEQVEAAINHGWLDLVQDDLEGEGYAFAPVGIPAAGVGAPHIRQRLWFVADAMSAGRSQRWTESGSGSASGDGGASQLAHHHHPGPQGREPVRQRTVECAVGQGRVAGELGDSAGTASQWDTGAILGAQAGVNGSGFSVDGVDTERPEHAGQGLPWSRCDWLPCRDGKWRPVEPGTFPLAHGVSNRVGRLRAYGNAIVPQVAAQVIQAYMECRPC